MYSLYPFIIFVFQEGFNQHNVVDTILALLSLINGIQLDGLKERMLLSGAGQLQIDGVHDCESDNGFSITHAFASPSENVSTIPEEGESNFLVLSLGNLFVCLFIGANSVELSAITQPEMIYDFLKHWHERVFIFGEVKTKLILISTSSKQVLYPRSAFAERCKAFALTRYKSKSA